MELPQSPPENFVQLVRETAQWCALHANLDDPEHSLRSPELATATPMDIWYPKTGRGYSIHDSELFAMFVQQVDVLAKQRRVIFAQQQLTSQSVGQLLIYDPSSTDSSGGSKLCSKGFFDVDDCPPSDTWICAVRSDTQYALQHDDWMPLLVCWIPEAYYPLVEKGIRCSPMECMGWIHSPSGPFYGGIPILETLHRQWQSAQT